VPDLDALLAPKLITATVIFDPNKEETELQFEFDVNKVTPLWFDQQTRGLEAGEIMTVADSLAEVIVNWNLTIAGEAVPIEGKTLARFPMGHLNLIMTAIAEQPTRAEGEDSSVQQGTQPSGSSAPAPTRLNGAATSESQRSSASLSGT
jgi:hypothetical protein